MSKIEDLKVLNEFLSYPLETGDGIIERFAKLDGAIKKGEAPARFVYVPGKNENKVLLVAHCDTWWDENHDDKGRGKGIGADDRAGCAILWLLKELGHSLLITDGEEQSSVRFPNKKGSIYLKEHHIELYNRINSEHQFMIQFDRMGSNDCKFYHVGDDKHDKFKNHVEVKMTGFIRNVSPGKTDICFLCREICGVNLSIGYYNEHSPDEYLDRDTWHNTLDLARKWLSEKNLPRFERVK